MTPEEVAMIDKEMALQFFRLDYHEIYEVSLSERDVEFEHAFDIDVEGQH